MAQRPETTVSECCRASCVWARFRIGSHTIPGQRYSQPTPTSPGQGCMRVQCNVPPALLAEWPGSFKCHCSNTWVEGPPNKNRQTKLILEEKILPPLLPGFELATFRPRDRRPHQQAVPAPLLKYLTNFVSVPCHNCATIVPARIPTYGVVPKGLLTFLGSLHKQVAKTTSGTLVYRFERQTARKK